MFDFFEAALKMVKSDEAIFAIVVVVALVVVVKVLRQRNKTDIKKSFSENEHTKIDLESNSDATVNESFNKNKDSEINIKL